ncbi:MAG TPA: pyrimidine reductase family protein [Casimicrobiaceae bacterium]|nr:pyrimidine reductase family protein [Casimicrobiaceae bacterium]
MQSSDEALLAHYAVAERSVQRVRANFISSIDGAATHEGRTRGLNDADDKKVFDMLRMLCDVLLVGAGTVRTEGYNELRLEDSAVAWRLEHGLAAQPTLAVVSGRLEITPEMPAFAQAPTRAIVLTHEGSSLAQRQRLSRTADVLVCGKKAVDPHAMLATLAKRALLQVLCEGGPHLLGTLIEADCVDELCLTVSPVVENGDAGRITAGAALTPRPMRLRHAITANDMLMLRYERAR